MTLPHRSTDSSNSLISPLPPQFPYSSYLLCLDFDLTLTRSHLFRFTLEAIRGGRSRSDALESALMLSKRQGVRGGEALWSALYRWLSAGHGLAITSFTSFPELPIGVLARGIKPLRKLGASREVTRVLSRPLIVYGDPAPQFNPRVPLPGTVWVSQDSGWSTSMGKNQHIEQALTAYPYPCSKAVLMDDDERNIELAQAAGHEVIWVNAQAQGAPGAEQIAHLHELDQLRVQLESPSSAL